MLEGLKKRAKGVLARLIKGGTSALLLCVFVLLQADDQQWISKELFKSARQDFGSGAEQRLRDWQALYQDLRGKDEDEQLRAVNHFFNNTAVSYTHLTLPTTPYV